MYIVYSVYFIKSNNNSSFSELFSSLSNFLRNKEEVETDIISIHSVPRTKNSFLVACLGGRMLAKNIE